MTWSIEEWLAVGNAVVESLEVVAVTEVGGIVVAEFSVTLLARKAMAVEVEVEVVDDEELDCIEFVEAIVPSNDISVWVAVFDDKVLDYIEFAEAIVPSDKISVEVAIL